MSTPTRSRTRPAFVRLGVAGGHEHCHDLPGSRTPHPRLRRLLAASRQAMTATGWGGRRYRVAEWACRLGSCGAWHLVGAVPGKTLIERDAGQRRAVARGIAVYHVGLVGQHRTAGNRHSEVIANDHGVAEVEGSAGNADPRSIHDRARIVNDGTGTDAGSGMEIETEAGIVLRPDSNQR